MFRGSRMTLPADRDERMANKVLAAFDDAPARPIRIARAGFRFARMAAGILLLAIVGGVLSYFGLPFDGSHTALAQVREALNQAAWIHVAMTEQTSDGTEGHGCEMWFSPQRKIRVIKATDPNAPILWSDYLSRERHLYEPASGRLTLSYEHHAAPQSQEPPWNHLSYLLGPDEFPRMRVTERVEVFGQQQARVYDITMQEDGDAAHFRLVADLASQLPVLMTMEAIGAESRQQVSMEAHFDYPATGPEDIYAVGVPRTAEVVDDRPTPEVEELARICKQYRSLFQCYIFVVIGSHGQGVIDQIEVSYVRGDTALAGREWKAITYGYVTWPPSNAPFEMDGLNDVDGILTWIGNEDRVRLLWVRLWDGRHEHSVQVREDHDPVYRKSRSLGGRRDLHEFAWPCYVPSGRIAEDDLSRQNGYLCWETQGRTFHFDPAHDYCCVRLAQSNGTWIRETLDFARLETGIWYPRTVQLTIVKKDAEGQEISREVTHTDRLYVQPVPEFPRGFFDSDRLPRTTHVLRSFPKVPNIGAQ